MITIMSEDASWNPNSNTSSKCIQRRSLTAWKSKSILQFRRHRAGAGSRTSCRCQRHRRTKAQEKIQQPRLSRYQKIRNETIPNWVHQTLPRYQRRQRVNERKTRGPKQKKISTHMRAMKWYRLRSIQRKLTRAVWSFAARRRGQGCSPRSWLLEARQITQNNKPSGWASWA